MKQVCVFWWRTTSLGASADSFARYTDCVIRQTNYWFRSITEQQLLETFFEALKDKTVIWITHHLQGVTLMDQVIFIEDGQLEMSGTPEELLATNAHYQKLYRIDRGISSFEE